MVTLPATALERDGRAHDPFHARLTSLDVRTQAENSVLAMSFNEPTQPADTGRGNTRSPLRHPAAHTVLALALLQLVWLLFCMPTYLDLVSMGAISALKAMVGFLGCIFLYIGAVRFAANTTRGSRLFFISLVLNALAVWFWRPQYAWSYPYIAACANSVAGLLISTSLRSGSMRS